MSLTSDQILKKFKLVASAVKQDLKKKGIAIPTKNSDGSINVEQYLIVKDSAGFYSIKNKIGDVVVGRINLPQSALLIANSLALGKMVDSYLYNLDQEYGFRSFEMELFEKRARKSIKKNNIDRADFLFTRLNLSRSRAKLAKDNIINSFEKLKKIH
jgi:hypothetical protein